jgi:hypothetical protein
MTIRTARVALTVALLLWSIPTRADSIATGTRLLGEGDTLADGGKFTEATIQYKAAFEQLLPGLRKLPFKHEVKRDVTPREDLKALLIKEIDSEITPGEFRGNELGMKALGFLPRSFNLKQAMVQVYSEEIAAFYDTKTKTMHLIREPESKTKKPPTFLERLLGKTGGFDKDENKTVIAHELTHALADQNFDIDAMQEVVKHDDDRSLAVSALIEGEATLAMIGASMQDWNGREIIKIPAANLDRVFSFIMPFMPLAGSASLREAPVILSETMIFPYLRGLVFCAHVTNAGGWDALDRAYRRPPLSTEQVIHPEKYLSDSPDLPMSVELGRLDPGPNWTEAGRNVVGEMQIGILLRQHGGKSAASGWDGDRYAVFEGPRERLGLVWLTTWDSDDDAREFVRGYARFQQTKTAGIAALPAPDATVPDTKYVVEQRGRDVAVVEGFPSRATAALVEAAFRAKKVEVTFPQAVGEKPAPARSR